MHQFIGLILLAVAMAAGIYVATHYQELANFEFFSPPIVQSPSNFLKAQAIDIVSPAN